MAHLAAAPAGTAPLTKEPATTRAVVPPTRSGPSLWGDSTLLLTLAALLAVDWFLPLRPLLTFGLLGGVTVLALPWVLLVLRAPPRDASSAGRFRSRLYHVVAVLLFLGFLAGKWLLTLEARSAPLEYHGGSRSYSLALFLVFGAGLLGRGFRFARFAALVADHPARLMAISFGATGLLGGLLLSLPISVQKVGGVSLVDNVFMAFSAVCVTGLAVNNLAQTYTLAGQVILCLLIQIGGLGIMVLSAAFALLAGQKLRVRSSVVLAEIIDTSSLASLRRSVAMIIAVTLVVEALGATFLYYEFLAHPEMARRTGEDLAGPGNIVWAAVFHAVSAFCNAGFSNTNSGLGPLVGSELVCYTVTLLIVVGGIGFPVLEELIREVWTRLQRKRPPVRTLGTRVALRTSALLLAVMTLAYLALEWRESFATLSLPEKVNAAVFQAASCRTAGFNVVDIGAMHPAMLVLTCAAMFIGGSPGSTAGGIKTTSLAVLFAGLRAELLGGQARLLDRGVADPIIRKAIGVAFLSMTFVLAGFVLLLLLEKHDPLPLAFETVSAFSTTGLSTGITPSLSVPGKLLVTLMMFVGRIGPMTLALALAARAKAARVSLPEERVMIG